MNDNIFREYDIRGIYPTTINEDVAYKIGLGYGSYLQEYLGQNTCIVSHDNRLSSDGLSSSLIKGLLETGINVINNPLIKELLKPSLDNLLSWLTMQVFWPKYSCKYEP